MSVDGALVGTHCHAVGALHSSMIVGEAIGAAIAYRSCWVSLAAPGAVEWGLHSQLGPVQSRPHSIDKATRSIGSFLAQEPPAVQSCATFVLQATRLADAMVSALVPPPQKIPHLRAQKSWSLVRWNPPRSLRTVGWTTVIKSILFLPLSDWLD